MPPREDRIYAILTAAVGLVLAAAGAYGIHRYLLWVIAKGCSHE